MLVDRVANNLFGLLRFIAIVCTLGAVAVLFSSGFAAAWPWARAAGLFWLPVLAPPFFARVFAQKSSDPSKHSRLRGDIEE